MQWANAGGLEKMLQTENREKRGIEKPITEAPLITVPMEHRVKQANKGIGELMHNYIGNTIYVVICSLNLTIRFDVYISGTNQRKIKSAR